MGRTKHESGSETAARSHAGNPAFLGRHTGRRVAPAALRRLSSYVFSASPLLSEVRLAKGVECQSQWPGDALQLRHPSSRGPPPPPPPPPSPGGTRPRAAP